MSIEGSLQDHRLLDLIAIFSHRGDSGRLHIDCGSAQGSLYFDKGKIAAARIGCLTGFSAINLAISLVGTRLRFDPLVEAPASEFTDPNERLLLNKLLGIETVVPSSRNDIKGSPESVAPARKPLMAPPSPEVIPPSLRPEEVTPPPLAVALPTPKATPSSAELTALWAEATASAREGAPSLAVTLPAADAMPTASELATPAPEVTPSGELTPAAAVESSSLEATSPSLVMKAAAATATAPSLWTALPTGEVTWPSTEPTVTAWEVVAAAATATAPSPEAPSQSSDRITVAAATATAPSPEAPRSDVTAAAETETPASTEATLPWGKATTAATAEVTAAPEAVLRSWKVTAAAAVALAPVSPAEPTPPAWDVTVPAALVTPSSSEAIPRSTEATPSTGEIIPSLPERIPPVSEVRPPSVTVTPPSAETGFTGIERRDRWKNVDVTSFLKAFVNRSRAFTTHKMALRAASVLIIGSLAAVGITSFRSKANRSASINMSPQISATVSSGGPVLGSTHAKKNAPISSNTSTATQPRPERSTSETKLIHYSKTPGSPEANAAQREESKAPPGGPAEGHVFDKDKRATKPILREIAVVVRIEDGHVAEAFIKNRRAGAEAYEATALRLARQRRYPKDTRAVETIIVPVVNEQ